MTGKASTELRRSPRIDARNLKWFPGYRGAHETYLDLVGGCTGRHGLRLHLGAGRDALGVGPCLALRRLVSVDMDPDSLGRNANPLRVVADGARLPFRTHSHVGVFCEHVFEHLTDPESVLREAHRVLQPGGRLVFLCPNRFSYIALFAASTPHRLHVWYKRRLMGTEPADTFETYYRLNTVSRIRKLAGRVGFEMELLRSFVGWPTYWESSDILHRFAVVLHWLIERGPRVFHVSLVGVLRKPVS